MAKLIDLNKKLFGRFPVYKDSHGRLTIKGYNNFQLWQALPSSIGFPGSLDWIRKHVLSDHTNQHGTFIKLNHTVR